MNVGLIAPAESGKTCYLVGLYGTLIYKKNRLLANEYALSYEWTEPQQKGNFESSFAKLMTADIGHDRFPPKTTRLTHYKVKTRHKKTNVSHEMQLIDFPGGLLRGDSVAGSGEGTPSMAEITRELTQCHAFIVLLDARHLLAESANPFKVSYNTATNSVADILQEAFRRMSKQELTTLGIPVAFCISKFDLLLDEQKDVNRAYEKVKQLFPEFFTPEYGNPVLITGVSLGEDIEKGGEFDPFQLEIPLEFCVAMCTLGARRYHDDETDEHAKNRDAQKKKMQKREAMNIVENFFDFVVTGEWAEDYKSQMEQNESSRQAARQKTLDFLSLGEEAARSVRDALVEEVSVISYKGKEHKFKSTINRWEFPLEEL